MSNNKTVIRKWLEENCTWKQQTVLLASFRGCDGVPKNDPSKVFTRFMRATLLKNADPKSTFFLVAPNLSAQNKIDINDFFIDCSRGSLDQYPVHWLMHLLQAAEIVGYKCPESGVAKYWLYFYTCGVRALHLNPETEKQLNERLADAR